MEITGQKTLSTDQISVTSNPYLKEIEDWNETELPHYKKKVADKMLSGYVSIVLGGLISYILYIAFFAITFSMFEGLYNLVSSKSVMQWVILFIFYLVVFIIVFIHGKKAMIKFISSCHGEIGHDGNPFIKRLILNIIISAIICVAGTILAFVFYKEGGVSSLGLHVMETNMYLPAIISPLAYFIGTLFARNQMSICPVCGRFDTVYRIKCSEDFGEHRDGSHTEYDYRTERVGTKTTTTYYTDGSQSSRSEGIYGSVRYTEVYDDFSSLAKYAYLCRECSYVEETLEEKKWKTLQNKYRG